MKFTDLSIDLETLGNRPGAVITQIGLAAFDRRGDRNDMASINIKVDPQDAMDHGLKADWSTIAWWLTQDDIARKGMAQQKGQPLRHALYQTGDFIVENTVGSGVHVWGNGCGFDVTFLEIAFNLVKVPVPWGFRNIRDMRTLADLLPAANVIRPVPEIEHDAQHDAMAQAQYIRRCTAAIERREVGEVPQSVSHRFADGADFTSRL